MVTKVMKWVPIMALLLVVSWRPYANYQILLHFLVCAGAVTMILALLLYSHPNTESRPSTTSTDRT